MHEAIKPQSSDYMEDQVQIYCVPTLSISQKLKKNSKTEGILWERMFST